MKKTMLHVSDFAKKSRVTLNTLHHYDKIGLLSPAKRGENNYRYYSLRQLSEINLIRTLQSLGFSLKEIMDLKERRTPERTTELFMRQIERMEEKMVEWINNRKLIATLLESMISVRDIDESAIHISLLPEEPIMLGKPNEYDLGEDGYNALAKFYDSITETYPETDINYPVWGLFSQANLKKKMNGEPVLPDRYYFYTPDGKDKRPEGLYACGYARGGYGQNDALYLRLRDYIHDHGFELCGNAYEEYPLNELCISDDRNYLMRVVVAVREITA